MCLCITDTEIKDIMDKMNAAEEKVGDFNHFLFAEQYDDEVVTDTLECLVDYCNAKESFHGISKFCLLFYEYPDFIIKLPLRGVIEYEYDDEDEVWNQSYTLYYHQAPTDSGWDYCAAEEDIYKEAYDLDIEQVFAETMCIGHTKTGYPVYVSERIEQCGTCVDDERMQIIRSYTQDLDFYTRCSSNVVGQLFGSYPIDIAMKVIEFLRNHNIDNDMHYDNYYHNDNGQIIFVDYSDFNEDLV